MKTMFNITNHSGISYQNHKYQQMLTWEPLERAQVDLSKHYPVQEALGTFTRDWECKGHSPAGDGVATSC